MTDSVSATKGRFTTPGILLRRVEYGDYDLILTFFSLENGKLTLIAKSAKRSVKRFGGILEVYSALELTCRPARGRGLPLLEEAALISPLTGIRVDVRKTAYAGYWTELIDLWMEAEAPHREIYHLLEHALAALDDGQVAAEELSIRFQMRFMALSGFQPELSGCSDCGTALDHIVDRQVRFDLKKGGLVCSRCGQTRTDSVYLSKGTLKQLLWTGKEDFSKARRVRFTSQGVREGLNFLEAFVPYHLEKNLRSLKFLRQVR